jgi:hypothetical protein
MTISPSLQIRTSIAKKARQLDRAADIRQAELQRVLRLCNILYDHTFYSDNQYHTT